tara:strand:- start:637 stop:1140 length:504 start_codon:yes stop_codon:yes gene_type:complete
MTSFGNSIYVDSILPVRKNAVVIQNTAMACVRTFGGFLDWNVYGENSGNPYDAGALKVRAGFIPENKVQQFHIAIDTSARTIASGAHANFYMKDPRYNESDWLSAQASASSVQSGGSARNLNVIPYWDDPTGAGLLKVWNDGSLLMDGTFHLQVCFPNRVKEGTLLP